MPDDSPKSLRVLLVEDYEINQKVALRMLQKLGVSADLAENGQEACDALESGDYDLVLMDCEMPILDGFGATTRIREREAETGDQITIIAMTAHSGGEEERRCREVGMNGFIEKPIRLETLRRTLDQLLES
jgi:CheY-like chemotaxis protein